MFKNRKRRPKIVAEPRCSIPRECVARMKRVLDAMPKEEAERFAGAAVMAGLKATRSVLDMAINKVEARREEKDEPQPERKSSRSFRRIEID